VAIMVAVTLRGVDLDAVVETNRRVGQPCPPGLIIHFAHDVTPDTVRIVDVWIDETAHDTFDEAHDPPRVLAGVLRERGLTPPTLVGREVFEIAGLIPSPTP
jgi:hypothetical protein